MRCDLARAVSSALLLLCLCAPHHSEGFGDAASLVSNAYATGLLISELYPCATSDDEYIVIANSLSERACLGDWTLEDGEGVLRFVIDIMVESRSEVVVSFNGSSYISGYGRYPDIEVGGGAVVETGSFRLADSGDSVCIRAPNGNVSDTVCYGQAPIASPGWIGEPISAPKKGEVLKRSRTAAGLVDSDSSRDWTAFREYRYGYTDLGPAEFRLPPGSLTAYVSPDCALDVVLGTIDRARDSIVLCSYELSSSEVCSRLARSVTRGVDVDVLVDGAPSGGMDLRQIACLSYLASSGVHVSVVKGDIAHGIVGHVGPLHAKYVVVDSSVTLIQSENMVESGVPTDRLVGNRGWGIMVADASMARFVQGLFQSDGSSLRRDVLDWRLDARFDGSAMLPQTVQSQHSTGLLAPFMSPEPALITLYPSPDSSVTSPFLVELIKSSRKVLVQQFQLDLYWRPRDTQSPAVSPLICALISSLESAASVKMLCDSTWFNLERNTEVVTYLAEAAAAHGSRGEFRLLDNSSPITVLHNKGIIMNDDTTLVSSNNWVWSSFARNRELAACVLCPAVAAYFAEAFMTDWVPDTIPPVADAGEDESVVSGTSLVLSANSSSDDRGIASYQWDIYADGSTDGWGEWIVFETSAPGTYRIRLTVEDLWGNEASDDIYVVVVADGDGEGQEKSAFDRWLWLVPAVIGALLVLGRAWRRFRGAKD